MRITFEQYDELLEKVMRIPNVRPGIYPAKEQLTIINETEFPKYMPYLVWLSETGGNPISKEHAESRKIIQSLLRDMLVFVDDIPEKSIIPLRVFDENLFGQLVLDRSFIA